MQVCDERIMTEIAGKKDLDTTLDGKSDKRFPFGTVACDDDGSIYLFRSTHKPLQPFVIAMDAAEKDVGRAVLLLKGGGSGGIFQDVIFRNDAQRYDTAFLGKVLQE